MSNVDPPPTSMQRIPLLGNSVLVSFSTTIKLNKNKHKSNKKLKNFKKWFDVDVKTKKPGQIQRYKTAKADEHIIQLVEQANAKGTTMERYARHSFKLCKRNNGIKKGVGSGYDHISHGGNKIEHKTAAAWDDKFTMFKWQHIELKHEWEYLLLTAIYPKKIRWYMIDKNTIINLVDKGLVTIQGKKGKSDEGLWMNYLDIKDYLTEIDEIDPDNINKYLASFIINKNLKTIYQRNHKLSLQTTL